MLLSAAVFFLCGCATLSLPLAVIPVTPTADDFPDAGVAVVEDDATLEYRVMKVEGLSEPKLVAVLDHRRRMKVLRPSGLNAATVDLHLDGFSTVIEVVARSVAPSGKVSNMRQRSIEYFNAKNPQERSPDIKIMRLHIPDATVGGLIEYRYQRVYTDPNLVPPWVFGDTMPVVHAEFGLVTTPELTLDYHYSVGPKAQEKAPLARTLPDGRERLVFIETDLPAFYSEPAMPPIAHKSPWVAVTLRTARVDEKKTQRLRGWDDVAQLVIDRMSQVGGKRGSGSVMARYDEVRKSIRPLLLPGLGLRAPVAAANLLKGSPACTRDAAALLLHSFVGADVAAYPAFLTSLEGPPLAIDFSGLYPFTRAVVAVELTPAMIATAHCTGEVYARDSLCGRKAGDLVFLDPQCKHCPFGVLPVEATGGHALILQSDGTTRWMDTPREPPEHHSASMRITYTLDVDGTFSGDLVGEARGTVAQRLRDALATCEGDQERAAVIGEAFLGENPGARPGGFTLNNSSDMQQPVGVKVSLSGKLSRDDFEHFRLSALDLAGSSLLDFWRGSRHNAARLAAPRWHEMNVEMTLPVGYVAELGTPVRISNALAEYAGGFAMRGQKLIYARRFVLKVPVVAAEDWATFMEMVEQIRDAEATYHKVELAQG